MIDLGLAFRITQRSAVTNRRLKKTNQMIISVGHEYERTRVGDEASELSWREDGQQVPGETAMNAVKRVCCEPNLDGQNSKAFRIIQSCGSDLYVRIHSGTLPKSTSADNNRPVVFDFLLCSAFEELTKSCEVSALGPCRIMTADVYGHLEVGRESCETDRLPTLSNRRQAAREGSPRNSRILRKASGE